MPYIQLLYYYNNDLVGDNTHLMYEIEFKITLTLLALVLVAKNYQSPSQCFHQQVLLLIPELSSHACHRLHTQSYDQHLRNLCQNIQRRQLRRFLTLPEISFFFNRGVEVSIEGSAILIGSSLKQICLAFAGNSDDSDIAIFGNVQQEDAEGCVRCCLTS
ncbi:hypothetical protein CUMW_081850 [Citrus unshiu]|nr:hypothetical protein CUMW_081850 [Citrus unshiu]